MILAFTSRFDWVRPARKTLAPSRAYPRLMTQTLDSNDTEIFPFLLLKSRRVVSNICILRQGGSSRLEKNGKLSCLEGRSYYLTRGRAQEALQVRLIGVPQFVGSVSNGIPLVQEFHRTLSALYLADVMLS